MSLQDSIVEGYNRIILESDEKIYNTTSPFLFERRACQLVELSLHAQGDGVTAG
jgi:hypothetical protein